MKRTQVLRWLSNAQRRTRWITSVGTGSLILGAAGLLNGARATTHWASRAELEPFGATYVRERYVQHGRIITAAGVSAGIDMALFLVRDLAGIAMRQAVQLAVEYDPQPLLPMITPPTNPEDLTVDTYQIMDQRMGKPHPQQSY
jgi:transcriptional regulator GlxA family with amidase domain